MLRVSMFFMIMILLTACSAPQAEFPQSQALVVITKVPTVPVQQKPETATATVEPTEAIPVTGSEPEAEATNAEVDVDGLNLRVGPG